jgi:membrane protein YdbS with pleckstrin-like domain
MKMVEEKIIKPPMERVKSGKIFKPSMALRNKIWIIGLIVMTVFWFMVLGAWVGFGYIIMVLDEKMTAPEFWGLINDWWLIVNIGYWLINMIWYLPGLALVHIYVKRIEYSVIGESGKTMPEIYVRKGLVTITEKHCPFRTITNIASKAGPLDRLLGIGTVEIQTAGISGGMQPGKSPEERIEGIPFFEEVRDFILQELRKFQTPYVIGTEVSHHRDVVAKEGELDASEETRSLLREIRDLLKAGR